MSLAAGTRLGTYEIGSPIGKGGMGEVYRARDTKLEREVAIKVLPEELASDADRRRRFEREARAASALNHPNIVTIYEIGEDDGTAYIAMELVRGKTLRALLDSGPIAADKLIRYATQIAEGLAKAHAAGIVHRDLKPENVVISEDDYVKILDFGLAKHDKPSEREGSEAPTIDKGHTTPGTIMGTLTYMSPEHAKGLAVDFRSDQFSVGSILHEMVTGQPLFRRDTPAETLSSILRDEPEPLRSGPASLGSVVRRLLAKRPEDRYPSTVDIVNELTSSSQSLPAVSVVVLPFVNRSPDPDNEYFSDGLTDEVISDLAGISALSVISRSSAMTLKGTTKNVPTLARELGVTHLVTGSVRRAGDAVRVTADLVEASTDRPIWSQKFSGTMEDVFGIQEAISRQIVSALKVNLTDTEEREVSERPIDDPAAYDCYLQAHHEMFRFTPDALDRAQKMADAGLELIGENPLLLATRGLVSWYFLNFSIRPEERYIDEATSYATRATERDPDAFLGVFLQGLVAAKRGDLEAAVRDIRRANELKPGNAGVMIELARHLFSAGQEHTDLGLYVSEEFIRVDPLNALNWVQRAWFLRGAGRLDETEHAARRAIELADHGNPARTYAAYTLAMMGQREEAVGVFDEVAAALPDTAYGSLSAFLSRALRGDESAAVAAVTPLLEQAAHWVEYLGWHMADGYALIGRRADALRWLREAIDRGFINYPYLTEHDPFLESIRDESEYGALMQEVHRRWAGFEA